MWANAEFRTGKRERGQGGGDVKEIEAQIQPGSSSVLFTSLFFLFLFFKKGGHKSAREEGRCEHQALTSQGFDSISFSAREWLVCD